ncbi:MAG: hypothetical protein P9M06_01830 [Candidatus Saelkia tenebricola]|nr:hypothetical protein [Candidatus Saelkia tenebricola]
MNKNIRLFLLVLLLFLGLRTVYAKIEYTGDQFRDPFQSYLPEANISKSKKAVFKKLKELNLTGVIWGGDLPLAIINDQVYSVGDSILEVEIMEINKTGVLLKYGEEAYILKPQ